MKLQLRFHPSVNFSPRKIVITVIHERYSVVFDLIRLPLFCFRLVHLSKPFISTGVVPTAAAAAASLMSDGGGTTL